LQNYHCVQNIVLLNLASSQWGYDINLCQWILLKEVISLYMWKVQELVGILLKVMMFQFKVGKTLELRDHSMVVSGTWELLVSAVKLIIMDEDRAGQMLAMEELL